MSSVDDDDVLGESFAALRETRTGAATESAATRQAILVAASQRRRRGRLLLRAVLPLAAVIAVSTAWAAATGRLGPRDAESFGVASAPRAGSDVLPRTTNAPAATEAPLAEPPGERASASPTIEAAAKARERNAPRTPAPQRVTSAASLQDTEDALYRAAHTAFFVDRDWPRALTEWDAYLAAHPSGRFVPEARYNRALSLVRLGRHDEAFTALRTFAEGRTYAGYRQSEARSLLEALRDGTLHPAAAPEP